jgi:hypothetical protein
MTETRKTLLIYLAIWSVSMLVALGSTLWLGLDARIPVDMTADGTVTKSRSAAVLWFGPGMAAVLYGAMALGAWFEARRARRKPPVELGDDARRGLALYGHAVRTGMVGFGLLILVMQLFTLLRASGIPAPLGLGREGMVRLFGAVAGVLFAYIGNVTPKVPWLRQPGRDTTPYYRADRWVGRILLLGGFGYVVSSLVLPFDRMTQANGWLILAMLGTSALVCGIALAASVRHQPRVGGDRQ